MLTQFFMRSKLFTQHEKLGKPKNLSSLWTSCFACSRDNTSRCLLAQVTYTDTDNPAGPLQMSGWVIGMGVAGALTGVGVWSAIRR